MREARRRPVVSVTSGTRTAVARATAVLLLSATVLTGCGGGSGVRIETSVTTTAEAPRSKASPLPAGPRPSPPAEPPAESLPHAPVLSPLPTGAQPISPPNTGGELDVLTLLREDPKVGEGVKRALRPCSAETWPVDVAYGRLTGDEHGPDIVINVFDCTDNMGLGSYVYRQSSNGQYIGVFADETPPVRAETNGALLDVTHQVYAEGDPACCPSGHYVVSYGWRQDRFVELARRHRSFGELIAPEPEPRRTVVEDVSGGFTGADGTRTTGTTGRTGPGAGQEG
ncbi:hypothetical protein V1L54_24925 [Streptomyces sp. TRM 70361]|uniref:hypothetical protein n=1 Tax=Streptomyces sp. TRM 70361 TaxID=3116553 RepID=UPI002E7BF247|nr:hypothetical protein [Streptomyces sp. TRM 70361]MEE1942608.1 hypothetical protein [Streptomyces sp. TRM 70361]